MRTLFLVEDEAPLRELLTVYLKEAGYEVITFDNGMDAWRHITDQPDLWVLDIMLPGMDGYTLIKEIKKVTPNVPVIFASARSAELDRVVGLEMGSDDYLPKPFLPRELVIRVDRILMKRQPTIMEITLPIGPYVFDRQKRAILTREEEITLSNKEYDLLEYLIKNKNSAVKRTDMIDTVWGMDYFGSDRVVDDTIRRLRKKMPDLPIEPVYGFGYILKGATS